jgi:prepilin-type N-terminal cleavage/methylation domain-containing protein
MDYRIRYKKNKKGFSLIELLVVLAIFSILLVISNSVYVSFRSSSNLKIATTSVVQAIRHAQINSQSVKEDSKWGVEILSNKIVVFKGENYATREVSADQNLDLPKGIIPTGVSEIVFEKLFGSTNTIGTIVLTNSAGVKNISINEKGTVSY